MAETINLLIFILPYVLALIQKIFVSSAAAYRYMAEY